MQDRDRSRTRRDVGKILVGVLLWPLVAAAQTVEVTMREYKFIPETMTIKVGTTVKWTNNEKRTTHSILFTGPDGLESERLFSGESFQRTFDKPGVYPYSCGPHPEMKGQVVVTQ